jgi:hypothetical protein
VGLTFSPCTNSVVSILLLLLLLLLFKINFCLLLIRWWSTGKERSQQEIKAIYPSTLLMMYAMVMVWPSVVLLLLL